MAGNLKRRFLHLATFVCSYIPRSCVCVMKQRQEDCERGIERVMEGIWSGRRKYVCMRVRESQCGLEHKGGHKGVQERESERPSG